MLIRANTIVAIAALGLGVVATSDAEARSKSASSAASTKGVAKTPGGTSAVKNGDKANRRSIPGRIISNGTHLDGVRAGISTGAVDAILLPTGMTITLR